MLCYVFICFSLSVVVLDVFGVLALFSKFYIGVYYTCDCSCSDMTISKMPLNMFQPSLMTFTWYYSAFTCTCAMYVPFKLMSQKLSNNTSAQAFLGPENAEVDLQCTM